MHGVFMDFGLTVGAQNFAPQHFYLK